MQDNMNEGVRNRMTKVENGISRRETTTVGNANYDVVYLEKFLADTPELNFPVEMPLSDRRLQEAVSEGNTYWATKSGEKLGPSHFIELWNEQKSVDASMSVDAFLEHLKISHQDWIEHIQSIQFAGQNLDRPIWLYSDEQAHSYPFDGMHHLTRAYLEGNASIKVIEWKELPEKAKLESNS